MFTNCFCRFPRRYLYLTLFLALPAFLNYTQRFGITINSIFLSCVFALKSLIKIKFKKFSILPGSRKTLSALSEKNYTQTLQLRKVSLKRLYIFLVISLRFYIATI
jgi:hypothetical protein